MNEIIVLVELIVRRGTRTHPIPTEIVLCDARAVRLNHKPHSRARLIIDLERIVGCLR